MATNSRGLYKIPKKVTSINGFIDDNSESLITSEMRSYMSKFSDPLNLNFKLMVDYDKTSGLFADEDKYKDSALAYLKRIGENERYNMLLKWISVFKKFIKGFDFLIQEVEGIDEIINHKTGDMYTDDAKITVTIRETSDMLCQSLLTTWRHIWFDDIRCVEVIPINLRRFDLNILIFNSGYYNLAIYDDVETQFFNGLSNSVKNNDDYQKKMFPTIKKLSDKYFIENANKYDFNHHLIMLKSVLINNEESGKNFFSTISNEMSDEGIKNSITFNFKFATYKGNFNNIFGEFDFVSLLAIAAVENKRMSIMTSAELNKEMSLAGNNTEPYMTAEAKTKAKFSDYFKNTNETFKQIGIDTLNELKSKPAEYTNNFFGPNSTIGSAIETITDPSLLANMTKNTIDLGITYIEDKYINGFVSNINSLVMNNFSENFVDVYNKYLVKTPTNIELLNKDEKIQNNSTQVLPNNVQLTKTNNNIKSNIYTRIGF